MLKGALIALVIIFIGAGSIIIPIVHFFLPWLSPFIAGFVGGGVANANEGRVTTFGLLVTALFLVPMIIFGVAVITFGERFLTFSPSLAAVLIFMLIPIAWFGVTLGALISYLIRSREYRNNY